MPNWSLSMTWSIDQFEDSNLRLPQNVLTFVGLVSSGSIGLNLVDYINKKLLDELRSPRLRHLTKSRFIYLHARKLSSRTEPIVRRARREGWVTRMSWVKGHRPNWPWTQVWEIPLCSVREDGRRMGSQSRSMTPSDDGDALTPNTSKGIAISIQARWGSMEVEGALMSTLGAVMMNMGYRSRLHEFHRTELSWSVSGSDRLTKHESLKSMIESDQCDDDT